jgi:hypothetical protein
VRLFQVRDVSVYASIAVCAGLLLLVQLLLSPPAYVAFALAALASLAVVAFSRKSLRAAQTFPELMRFRLARVIAGG